MKVDASQVKSINGNISTARKPADNSVVKNANQDVQHVQHNNTVAKAPNQDSPQIQHNNLAAKTPNQDEPQSQARNQEREKIEKALKVINLVYKEINVECNYSFDDRTNTEVVTIINSDTGETIRQYPPEEILNMIHKMYDMYGILMDKKV